MILITIFNSITRKNWIVKDLIAFDMLDDGSPLKLLSIGKLIAELPQIKKRLILEFVVRRLMIYYRMCKLNSQ
jgi:hypothetical protein